MAMFKFLFILAWIICSILAYGFEFAYWQKKYPDYAKRDYQRDKDNAMLHSVLGPIWIVIILFFDMHKHGLKFW